jgi:hypothetical protein
MFEARRHLSRRTFLRGAGVTLGLPLLDAMVPALTALAQTAASPQRRVAFVYIPHGVIMDQWTPATTGSEFALTPLLQPLAPFHDRLVVVSNLARAATTDNHAVSAACWLTGVVPKRTDGPDFEVGTTVDQLIARQIGRDTTFASLELATEDFSGLLGACDPGYSCAYMNTLNWATPTTPLPMEVNPRVVFERLFGTGATSAQRQARRATDRSILDFVTGQVGDLARGLGAGDRRRLDEYLGHVREVERRIQLSEQRAETEIAVPDAPVGVPEAYEEHVGLLFELMALAYEADLTRVATFMLAREVSSRTYPQVGVREPHHTISHHQNKPEAIAMHARVNAYHVELFARFVARLETTADGDGSLLDHTLLVYGSGMSDGNGHTGEPLPLALIGGAGGTLRGNRHLMAERGTPMANLLLAVADKAGASLDTFGVSTGRIGL